MLPSIAAATDIGVISSGGFTAAYRTLAPAFECTTGNHLVTGWGPSMGDTPDAVPQRIQRHEPIDVVIMVSSAPGQISRGGEGGWG